MQRRLFDAKSFEKAKLDHLDHAGLKRLQFFERVSIAKTSFRVSRGTTSGRLGLPRIRRVVSHRFSIGLGFGCSCVGIIAPPIEECG